MSKNINLGIKAVLHNDQNLDSKKDYIETRLYNVQFLNKVL